MKRKWIVSQLIEETLEVEAETHAEAITLVDDGRFYKSRKIKQRLAAMKIEPGESPGLPPIGTPWPDGSSKAEEGNE